MRFVVVHKAASYLMVATGLVALLSPGEIHPLLTALVAVAMVVSWFWEPPRVDLARFERGWTGLTVALLGWSVFDIVTGGSGLLVGVQFVLFLTINKLFNRKQSADYQQLYVLSFLEMIAATVINTDLVYGAAFLVYVVATTWTLMLFHLRREMEDNFLLKYGDGLEGRPVQVDRVLNSRKLVGARFLGVTSVLSLMVFAGALTIFFAFPRVGFGFFAKKQRSGITMAGFSDRVELGTFGRIKDDPTVVMRVEFPEGGRNRLLPYWRGIAFDHYDGVRWTKSDATLRCAAPRAGPLHVMGSVRRTPTGCTSHAATRRPPSDVDRVVQNIYLEPMGTAVVFGLSRLDAVRLGPALPGRRPLLNLDAEGDLHYVQRDELAFRYTALSTPETVETQRMQGPLAAYQAALPPRVRQTYLQLPELSAQVRALARQIVGDADTPAEAVRRVEAYLGANYRYTLDLKRDDRLPPLDDFLFVQRQGHCEYFATAMIVLLRAAGIPARNVNGFLGGRWNPYGDYLAVSQGDAHSWVEVWVGPDQWWTRDPTPSGSGPGAQTGWFDGLRAYTDALRLRWYKYVIEYDLKNQIGTLRDLASRWRRARAAFRSGAWRSGLRALAPYLGAFALCIGLVFAWRQLRRPGRDPRQRAARRQARVADLFDRLTRRYARLGLPHQPQQTVREYLTMLERRRAPDFEVAQAVCALYEAVRFGGAPLPLDRVSTLRRAIKRIGKGA